MTTRSDLTYAQAQAIVHSMWSTPQPRKNEAMDIISGKILSADDTREFLVRQVWEESYANYRNPCRFRDLERDWS